jgi:hypothetical protein
MDLLYLRHFQNSQDLLYYIFFMCVMPMKNEITNANFNNTTPPAAVTTLVCCYFSFITYNIIIIFYFYFLLFISHSVTLSLYF